MQKNVDKNISDPLKFLKTIYLGDRGVTGISRFSICQTPVRKNKLAIKNNIIIA